MNGLPANFGVNMVLYNFGFQEYFIFLLLLAATYVVVFNFAQGKIGGARNIRALQTEMREIQKKMTEAAKSKDEKVLNEAISQNWKITMEIMAIQLKLMAIIFGILIPLSWCFPYVEPGTGDDIVILMADSGLPLNCDALQGDGIYSGCINIPNNVTLGAWTVDVFLKSEKNETLARNATAIFCNGGQHEDVWLQSSSANGIMDMVSGKKQYGLNISNVTDKCLPGSTLSLYVRPNPEMPQGAHIEAMANSGTFLYLDLPFAIPLINIRRIIGSYGIFIFLVFMVSMAYGLGKSAYLEMKKRMEIKKI